MSQIACAPMKGAFPRIVLSRPIQVEDDAFVAYVDAAIDAADKFDLPVHIQDRNQFTMHIVWPDAR